MNRRQFLFLNIVLLIAAVLLAFRLSGEWRRANLRYAALQSPTADASESLPPVGLSRPVPDTRAIVEMNLFSADRTSTLVQEETEQPVSRDVPVVFGTINLGDAYEALMSDRRQAAAGKFQRVKTGQRVGAYTVLEIHDEKVVLDLEGQTTTLDVYQSARSVARRRAPSARPAAAPVVETAGSAPSQPAPSSQPGAPSPAAGVAAIQQDPGPRVTIEGNRRRIERMTPFGPQVWYEDIE